MSQPWPPCSPGKPPANSPGRIFYPHSVRFLAPEEWKGISLKAVCLQTRVNVGLPGGQWGPHMSPAHTPADLAARHLVRGGWGLGQSFPGVQAAGGGSWLHRQG